MINYFIAFTLGYMFGCFQTSYFISKKITNKDIRKMGSGNAGASNVTSEIGLKFGIITALIDIFKSYLPVKLILIIFPSTNQQIELMVLAGTAAILGHIFPFFMNFKGGKGIASYLGMLLGIDLQLGGIIFLCLCAIIIITNYVAIGSLSLYIAIPIIVFYCHNHSNVIIICSLVLLLVGILKHIINIKRIINGSELSLRAGFKKNNG